MGDVPTLGLAQGVPVDPAREPACPPPSVLLEGWSVGDALLGGGGSFPEVGSHFRATTPDV